MQFEFSYYTLPLLIAALVSLVVAGYAWRHRANPSAVALVWLSLMIAQWSIGYAIEIAASDLPAMAFWGKFQYIGITTVPLFWLIFAYNHANPGRRMPLAWVFLLGLIPLTTIVLVMTTEWHGLVWGEIEVARLGDLTTLGVVSRGWWFWVHFAYSYLLLMAGTYILVRSMWRMRGVYRRQMVVLVIALLAPWIGNILYFVFGINPDPTPFAFSITVAGILWGIFGYRLVDVAPLARDLIVDGMRDGMIALDLNGRVADVNPAAARMIGLPFSDLIGRPVAEALSPWPHLIERFQDVSEGDAEISVGQGEATRRYHVRIAQLVDARDNPIGRLINLHELDQTAPPPRFAEREPPTKPYPRDELLASALPETSRAAPNPVLFWLKKFFMPPALGQAYMPESMNPSWAQTIEQAVTVSARLIMVFGSIAAWNVLSNLNMQEDLGYATAVVLFLAVTYFVALTRTTPFYLRIGVFLFLVYVMALAEMLKYGFSSDIFLYFIVLVILAHMLLDVRGGFWMLALSVVTMIAFAWFVLSGRFVPTEVANTTAGLVLPIDSDSAATSIMVYLFSSLTMMTVVNMFILNLNQAWKKETQALNLVQQERDLLEQRVIERTSALADARDLEVKRSNELRKYFQAIEQSGNMVVITDTNGDIEYANPRFTQLTGYSLDESMGRNLNILSSGEHSGEFFAEMWGAISSGKIWRGEFHNRRKDGSLFWELATIAPVHDQEGSIINYVAVKEDITADKELREQLQKQNQYLSILHQTTLDLLNRRSLDDLLNAVVERACSLLDAPVGEIMLKEGNHMVVRAFTKNQPFLAGEKVDRSQAKLSWQAHDTGQPVVLDDYSTWLGRRTIYDSNPLHAVADFPVMLGGECIGVLALGRNKRNLPFTPAQIETGRLFAQMVSLVLDNANLYDSALREIEQRKQAEERNLRFVEDMKSLQEIHMELSQVKDSEQLYIRMIENTQRRLGLDRVGLFLLDDSGNSLMGTYGVSPDGQVRDEHYYQEEVGPEHWTWEVVNAPNHTRLWEDAPLFDNNGVIGTGWKVASTLWTGEKAAGFMVCDNLLTSRPPRAYEVELITLLGSTFGHIVERNRNEILLQQSEVRFRQIVENASDIIYRADTEGCFTYVNPTALNAMGFKDESEVLGRTYLELAKPEWRTKLKRFYVRQFLRGEQNTYFEFESFTQDGREIWIGQNVQIIKDGEKVVGFQAVARDITKLKQAQEALALARDQALDANRFKSQMLAKISHELRTPLGAVMGYAELLQNNLFGVLNEEQKDAADNIIDSANYLNTIIGELLDQAQIESRSVHLRNLPFSPAELSENVVSTMTVLAQKKGLTLLHSVAPEVPETLLGDSKRLQQILINLTGNAIKFTDEGSVRIELLRPENNFWAIRVSDTGAGIPQEAQEYIFEPFRQVDNAITHYNRGTGLGLSITKQLVELMDGHIDLESEVGRGSTFTVTLPILFQ